MSDPVEREVQIRGLPGVRFREDSTPAGNGFVWLRPAFIALRVPVELVEVWDPEPTERDRAFAATLRK